MEFLQFNSLSLLKGLCKGIDEDLVKGKIFFGVKNGEFKVNELLKNCSLLCSLLFSLIYFTFFSYSSWSVVSNTLHLCWRWERLENLNLFDGILTGGVDA